MGGGAFPIYYNITRGSGGSLGTPNLYYVIYGRPLSLLTLGHWKVVSRFFSFYIGFFLILCTWENSIFAKKKRKDSTTIYIKQNLIILVTPFQIWLWNLKFTIFVCLFLCTSLFANFARKMVQSWFQNMIWNQDCNEVSKGSHRFRKVQFFLTLFKRPLPPPPLLFEHYVVNFSEGILTKVRKRVSQQLSTK